MTDGRYLTLGLIEHPTSSEPYDDAELEAATSSWSRWQAYRERIDPGGADLFGRPNERKSSRRVVWLGVSLAVQALLVAGLLLASVMSDEPLPERPAIRTFLAVAPPSVPPPPSASMPPGLASNGGTGEIASAGEPVARPGTRIPPHGMTAPDIDWNAAMLEPSSRGSDAYGVPGGALDAVVGVPFVPPAVPSGAEPSTQPLRVGSTVPPPAKLVHVAPEYPALATDARVEGQIILEATVDEVGVVTSVRVLRSIPLLDRAAIDAVRQWRYAPTVVAGVPVPIRMTVVVTFALG